MTGRRYEIKFDPYARESLDSIDISIRRRILTKIESLAVDPWPHGATMLKGQHGDLRIRVGDRRIIYTVEDAVLLVLVIEVNHRGEIYRS